MNTDAGTLTAFTIFRLPACCLGSRAYDVCAAEKTR